jgi:membrane-associated phospholipid phosphatase
MKKRWIALIVFLLTTLLIAISYFNWDFPLLYYCKGLDVSILNIAQIVTAFGKSTWYFILFIPAYILFRFVWKNKLLWSMRFLFLLISISASGLISILIKWLVGRYRPSMLEKGFFGFNYFGVGYELTSFPSGHTVTAFSLATAISILFPRAGIAAFIIAISIGMSRIMLTSHYLSDVIGGAGIGILCTLAVKYFFDRNKIQPCRIKESK